MDHTTTIVMATVATGNTNNTNSTAVAKRKPVFIKVDQLKPGTSGHTLTVKVVSSKTVKATNNNKPGRSTMLLSRPLHPTRIAECLVGDESATIVFTARNDQGLLIIFYSLLFLN